MAEQPKYPIFVPTKGRHKSLLTIKALETINVPYTAVIEEQEYDDYASVMDEKKLLVLPHRDKGLTVTRNWIWDYAENELGVDYFWTMDDNIRNFYRLNHNMKYRCKTGTFLRAMESFIERYENVYISGMQYNMFVPRRQRWPPFIGNTRIYSNMLIKTGIPYRNVTYFNDDTDLCLRVLKDGHCTVLFYAFLIEKMHTMIVKGGMTDYYKETNKRKEFAEELQKAHPDVVSIVWKYGRWHHHVDYRRFRNNKRIFKPGFEMPENKVDNFGMIMGKKE